MNIQIPNELISPYFAEKLLDITNDESNKEDEKNMFEIGALYSLQGETCDDFEMPIKIYELKKVVKSINEMVLNAIVVKQVNASEGGEHIFSLTKADCQLIDIPFEEKLEIYPMGLGWKRYIKEKKEAVEIDNMDMKYFSSKDLSTYPNSREDESIRRMTIKINWIEFIKTIKDEINDKVYLKNLIVKYTDSFKELLRLNMIEVVGKTIKYEYVTKEISPKPSPYNDYLDLEGNVYIEIAFHFTCSQKEIGIMPDFLKDKSLSDFLIIEIFKKDELKKIDEELKREIANTLRRALEASRNRSNSRENWFDCRLENYMCLPWDISRKNIHSGYYYSI